VQDIDNLDPTDDSSLKLKAAASQKTLTPYFCSNKILADKLARYAKEFFLASVINCICIWNYSIWSVFPPTFYEMIQRCNVTAANDIPNCNKMRDLITACYFEATSKINNEVNYYPGHLSLLLFGWTSRNNKAFYCFGIFP
jgi:hypothetical protein